jgi:hypothetical protein
MWVCTQISALAARPGCQKMLRFSFGREGSVGGCPVPSSGNWQASPTSTSPRTVTALCCDRLGSQWTLRQCDCKYQYGLMPSRMLAEKITQDFTEHITFPRTGSMLTPSHAQQRAPDLACHCWQSVSLLTNGDHRLTGSARVSFPAGRAGLWTSFTLKPLSPIPRRNLMMATG